MTHERRSMVNVLLAGVGGQGVLTAAQILGEAGHRAGLPVRVGQLHGMAQRGGSVSCTVNFGFGSTSFTDEDGADLLIGFEPIETLRLLPDLRKKTTVLFNTGRIAPFSLAQKGRSYPHLGAMFDQLRAIAGQVLVIDAAALLARISHQSPAASGCRPVGTAFSAPNVLDDAHGIASARLGPAA